MVLVECLGQDRPGIALASAALGENGKDFGRGIEREVHGTKEQMHGRNVRHTQRQGCVRSFRIVSWSIDVCFL
jgi:hypothetical protein